MRQISFSGLDYNYKGNEIIASVLGKQSIQPMNAYQYLFVHFRRRFRRLTVHPVINNDFPLRWRSQTCYSNYNRCQEGCVRSNFWLRESHLYFDQSGSRIIKNEKLYERVNTYTGPWPTRIKAFVGLTHHQEQKKTIERRVQSNKVALTCPPTETHIGIIHVICEMIWQMWWDNAGGPC